MGLDSKLLCYLFSAESLIGCEDFSNPTKNNVKFLKQASKSMYLSKSITTSIKLASLLPELISSQQADQY